MQSGNTAAETSARTSSPSARASARKRNDFGGRADPTPRHASQAARATASRPSSGPRSGPGFAPAAAVRIRAATARTDRHGSARPRAGARARHRHRPVPPAPRYTRVSASSSWRKNSCRPSTSAIWALRIGSSIRSRAARRCSIAASPSTCASTEPSSASSSARSSLRRRLGQRATKIGNRALRRPTRAGPAGGVAQRRHDRRISRRRLRNRWAAARSGSAPASSSSRAARRVCALPLARRHRLIHRGTDQRVNESQRRGRTQHLDARQRARRVRDDPPPQAPRARPRAADQHPRRARRQPAPSSSPRAEGRQDEPRPPASPRAPRSRARAMRWRRSARAPSAATRVHQLTQEQRIAARLPMTGHRECVLGIRRRRSSRSSRAVASTLSSAGANDRRKWVRHDLADERLILARLALAVAPRPPAARAPPFGAGGRPASATTPDRSTAGHRPRAAAALARRGSPSTNTARATSPTTNPPRDHSQPGRDQTPTLRVRQLRPADRLAHPRARTQATARTIAGQRQRRTSAQAPSRAHRAPATPPPAPAPWPPQPKQSCRCRAGPRSPAAGHRGRRRRSAPRSLQLGLPLEQVIRAGERLLRKSHPASARRVAHRCEAMPSRGSRRCGQFRSVHVGRAAAESGERKPRRHSILDRSRIPTLPRADARG